MQVAFRDARTRARHAPSFECGALGARGVVARRSSSGGAARRTRSSRSCSRRPRCSRSGSPIRSARSPPSRRRARSRPTIRRSRRRSSRRSRRRATRDALRIWLERLAGDAADADARVAYLVRAAEIAERRPAVTRRRCVSISSRATRSTRGALVTERLAPARRARALPAERRLAAVRRWSLRCVRSTRDAPPTARRRRRCSPRERATSRRCASPSGSRAPARSAPQLANALALAADGDDGDARAACALRARRRGRVDAARRRRALARGIASSRSARRDAVVLDDLVRRARARVAAGDRPALELAIEATDDGSRVPPTTPSA